MISASLEGRLNDYDRENLTTCN